MTPPGVKWSRALRRLREAHLGRSARFQRTRFLDERGRASQSSLAGGLIVKYVIWYHGPNEPQRVTVHAPSVGLPLDPDEARRVLVDALEHVTDQRAAAAKAEQ